MNLDLSEEMLKYLAELVGKCEGDFTAAGQKLHNIRRSSAVGKHGKALMQAMRQLEEQEIEDNLSRARQLREHLAHRGAVATDCDVEALASSYTNYGVGSSAYLRRSR